MQSTLFGPVKYSVLPRFFEGERLVAVNSLWNGSTFVAILLGTIIGTGGFLMQHALVVLISLSLGVAILGAVAAWRVPPLPAPQGAVQATPMTWQPVRALWRILKFARAHRAWPVMLAISVFWMVGAMILTQIPLMARTLGGAEHTLMLLLVFTVSVGIGVAGAWWLNRRQLHVAWTLLWLVLLALWGGLLLISWPQWPAGWWSAFIMLAVTGGLMVVPLYVWLQRHTDETHRGRIFAALNVLNALAMIFGALILMGYHAVH